MAVAIEGHWTRPLHYVTRIALFGVAFLLIKPGGYTDLVGVALLAAIGLKEYFATASRNRAAARG